MGLVVLEHQETDVERTLLVAPYCRTQGCFSSDDVCYVPKIAGTSTYMRAYGTSIFHNSPECELRHRFDSCARILVSMTLGEWCRPVMHPTMATWALASVNEFSPPCQSLCARIWLQPHRPPRSSAYRTSMASTSTCSRIPSSMAWARPSRAALPGSLRGRQTQDRL